MSARRVVFLAALAPALACGGLGAPPEIRGITATADGCGGWTATVAVDHAEGAAVELRIDGVPRATRVVGAGEREVGFGGVGAVDAPVALEARVGGSAASTSVTPTFTAGISLADRAEFPSGAPPHVALALDGCRTDGLTWRATTARWVGNGTLARTGPTDVALPPQPDGVHELRVDVLRDADVLGSAVANFYVGDPAADVDGDGYPSRWGTVDCDDTDPEVHPDAAEKVAANRIDEDCDGVVDEGTRAHDDDGDGLSEDDGDCDDADPLRHPGAAELPDCRDQDCDGRADEGVTLAATDDALEDDDAAPRARPVELDAGLALVSRGMDDEEWLAVAAASAGVRVELTQIAEGAAYDVEIRDAAGRVRGAGRVVRDHESVAVGAPDDVAGSGSYLVRIRPARLPRSGCPLAVVVRGG